MMGKRGREDKAPPERKREEEEKEGRRKDRVGKGRNGVGV